MAEPPASPSTSALDPTAPSFTMSSQNGVPPSNLPNGFTKPTKADNPPKSPSEATPAAESSTTSTKLSGAELKKQKAAEKAARRADKVAEKGVVQLQAQQPHPTPTQQTQPGPSRPTIQRRPSSGKKDTETPHHRRTGSTTGRSLPLRPSGPPGPSTAATADTKPTPHASSEKRVPFLSHLSTHLRRSTIAGTAKDVHPAVLTLGLQIRDHVICGGNARLVAMMLVFKKVVGSYATPPGTALSRHLTQHLSHQIAFLSRSRPLSVGQGNAIRWLKKLISALDPDLSDSDARRFLCGSISSFVREKVSLADEVIAKEAAGRIAEEGEVVLIYGKSSIVLKSLLLAKKMGKRFRVVVADSRPLFEGRNAAMALAGAGVRVEYALLSGLMGVLGGVTKCFLGASGMTGNGRLYSRAGTASVAMMAKECGAGDVPVVVLCETVKFTSKAALDSVMMNELAEPGALVDVPEAEIFTEDAVVSPPQQQPSAGALKGGGKKASTSKEDEKAGSEDMVKKRGLQGWREQANLYLLNLMYDVTPADYLDLVITEMGCMPPSGVPVVNGVQEGGD